MATAKIEEQVVVREFVAEEHENHHYKVNDPYPAEGFKATKARIEQLSNPEKNSYKKVYLAPKQTPTDKE